MEEERKTAAIILGRLAKLLEERGRTSSDDIFGLKEGDVFYQDCEDVVTDIIKIMGV